MKNKKMMIWIVLAVLGAVAVFLAGSYLMVHGYYMKMNIDDGNEVYGKEQLSNNAMSYEEGPEYEEEEAAGPDSDQADINALEDAIRINMKSNAEEIEGEGDVFNILLIGCDTRQEGGTGRADSIILISINKKQEKIVATSIMRDIYVEIPGYGNNRINAAYAYGGADLLMETIEKNFKIEINRYASADFFVFMDIVDQIGGVEMEVSDEEAGVMNGYINDLNFILGEAKDTDCLKGGGTYLLNGKQALGYSRIRYVGNADFERTQRQRNVLEQIFLEIKDCNLIELNSLLNKILPEVTTDLTEGETITLALGMSSYGKYELVQSRVPYDGTYRSMRIRGMAVLGIDFEENIRNMKRDIYQI